MGAFHVKKIAAWTTLIDAIRLDNDPTFYNSAALDVEGYAMVALLVAIDSTLAPTDVRIVVQFSDDGGTTWWDYEEGFWASLYWEDTATATEIHKAFVLPVAGFDSMRICAVATGTDAGNYFDVTVKARPFTGAYMGAHA
jgi:hypothetical protein